MEEPRTPAPGGLAGIDAIIEGRVGPYLPSFFCLNGKWRTVSDAIIYEITDPYPTIKAPY
jgi:hypothetical protein